MASEYNAAQRVLHRIKQHVSEFELGASTSDTTVMQAAIAQDLQTLGQRISEYRLLGRQETNERKHKMMLDRAATMGDEHEQLKRRYEKLKQHKAEQALHRNERSELFQRGAGASRAPMDTAVAMDPQDEESFWGRAEQELDGYIAQGVASLDNLREQRGFLHNAHRRILNAGETLGLSQSVIALINRRTAQDKIILGSGMVFTCIFIYAIVHYFG
ncbi:protein transport protein bos1 [Coemansia biformis]|uniref:Protein transport protein BOS1 n=1 Tax=Coemansia biformis TaxID=1286918 RepID=A0A9W7YCF2_9FUNG|nr:protein transport protein bos1 [Coemansia biformis]